MDKLFEVLKAQLRGQKIAECRQTKADLQRECSERIHAIEFVINNDPRFNINILRLLRLFYTTKRCVIKAKDILVEINNSESSFSPLEHTERIKTRLTNLNNELQSTQTKLKNTLQCL